MKRSTASIIREIISFFRKTCLLLDYALPHYWVKHPQSVFSFSFFLSFSLASLFPQENAEEAIQHLAGRKAAAGWLVL